jgi:gliding motility-associated-like protein
VGPNAFRPSSIAPQYSNKFGDFTNKEFFLYSYFISDNFEIAIYNRWGELVFQSSDKYFRWNGGYNNNGGQPLPGGTYTYVVRYQSSYRPQDGTKEQRGGVVLLR